MKAKPKLIGHKYEELFKNYLGKYRGSLALTQKDDQSPIDEELENIKNHFSKNPELYGGTNRLARTDAQWQKRIEYLEEKEHLLGSHAQTIENPETKLLENCIREYKKVYSLSREAAIAQIEKEFAEHSSTVALSAGTNSENRLAWLANHQKSLEKEEILQNELITIKHEVKNSRKPIDLEDDVLNQELLDDVNKGFLKSSIQRMAIFEEYRDRLVQLRDNYIHNVEDIKANTQERSNAEFIPSSEKLGGIKSIPPHVNIGATYRSPNILIYHQEIDKSPTTSKKRDISFDERTMRAQKEVLSKIKVPLEKKRKADDTPPLAIKIPENLLVQTEKKRKADEALTSKEDSLTIKIPDYLLGKNPSSSTTHKRLR